MQNGKLNPNSQAGRQGGCDAASAFGLKTSAGCRHFAFFILNF
jgi:hypothetical protein